MKITVEVDTSSNPSVPSVKLHNVWTDSDKVEIEIEDKLYRVNAKELIRAVNVCLWVAEV